MFGSIPSSCSTRNVYPIQPGKSRVVALTCNFLFFIPRPVVSFKTVPHPALKLSKFCFRRSIFIQDPDIKISVISPLFLLFSRTPLCCRNWVGWSVFLFWRVVTYESRYSVLSTGNVTDLVRTRSVLLTWWSILLKWVQTVEPSLPVVSGREWIANQL